VTSRREDPRRTILDELRANHRPRYDAVDNEHWGCICISGVQCLFIILVEALNKAEQETIRALADLRKEYDKHRDEVRTLTTRLAGAETYSRLLKEENDVLQAERNIRLP
jgi:hypothetical protein